MSKLPPTRRTITGAIRQDREQVRKVRNGSPFFGTGFHPNGLGGMDSDNYEAGVSGYRFSDNGNAEFNDLTLRGGIIGNDALTSPVVPGVLNDSSGGFAISTAYATVYTGSVTVPAGFTSAAISVVARVFAINDGTSSVDYLRIRPVVAGNTGTAVPIAATNAGGSATATTPMSVVLNGLTGGSSVTVSIQAAADYAAWPADALNRADLSGSVLWFR